MEFFLFGILLIIASFLINDNQETKTQRYKRTQTTKVPFRDAITADERVDVQPFVKLRDAINSINPSEIAPANLFIVLNKIEKIIGRRMFRRETMDVEGLLEMKEKLNIANLDSRKTISLHELFGTTEDEVIDYVNKYQK